MRIPRDRENSRGEFDTPGDDRSRPSAARDAGVQGEIRLWCAVVEQAFMDLGLTPAAPLGRGETPQRAPETDAPHPLDPARPQRRERREAALWLLCDNPDFAYVCSLAGLAPSVLRRAALALATPRKKMGAK